MPRLDLDPNPPSLPLEGIMKMHSLQKRDNSIVALRFPCGQCNFELICSSCALEKGIQEKASATLTETASSSSLSEESDTEDVEVDDEEGENSASDSDESSLNSESNDEDEDDVTIGSHVWAPFSARQYFPATVVSLTDVPTDLRRFFAKLSTTHVIVKWIGEDSQFTSVRKLRLDPIATTELDRQRASRNPEVMRRYQLALDSAS